MTSLWVSARSRTSGRLSSVKQGWFQAAHVGQKFCFYCLAASLQDGWVSFLPSVTKNFSPPSCGGRKGERWSRTPHPPPDPLQWTQRCHWVWCLHLLQSWRRQHRLPVSLRRRPPPSVFLLFWEENCSRAREVNKSDCFYGVTGFCGPVRSGPHKDQNQEDVVWTRRTGPP